MNLFILYHFQWHCTIVNNQIILLFPPMVYREKLTSHHIHHYETFDERELYDLCTFDITVTLGDVMLHCLLQLRECLMVHAHRRLL